jgi:hypothetical protein
MSDANWAQVVSTVFLGLVGLWLAQNYRRQVRLKLAERQVDAYTRLWTLTAPASPERTTPLARDELLALREEMSRWYFDDGDGIFASTATRDLYVAVRDNLTCPIGELRPAILAQELARLPAEVADRRRGCAVIRQMSLLRTQLKLDLAVHFGFTYYSGLRPDDRAFLRVCGLSPWRRPWRSGPLRRARQARRGAANPCVCGGCNPAGGSPSVSAG